MLIGCLITSLLSPCAPVPVPGSAPVAVLRDTSFKQDDPECLTFLKEQARFFCSDGWVIPEVVRRPKVAKLTVVRRQKDPREWLKKNLRVEVDPRSGTFRVWVADGCELEQRAVADAVCEAYLAAASRLYRASLETQLKRGWSKADSVRMMIESNKRLVVTLAGENDQESVRLRKSLATLAENASRELESQLHILRLLEAKHEAGFPVKWLSPAGKGLK